MATNTHAIHGPTLLDELINTATELPFEYLNCVLAIAKGMSFSKKIAQDNLSCEHERNAQNS